MASEVAMVIQSEAAHGVIPETGAALLVEVNGGIVQSVRAKGALPFPIKVYIRDHDNSRVNHASTDDLWILGLPGESLAE
jgi:hypothetical protein